MNPWFCASLGQCLWLMDRLRRLAVAPISEIFQGVYHGTYRVSFGWFRPHNALI